MSNKMNEQDFFNFIPYGNTKFCFYAIGKNIYSIFCYALEFIIYKLNVERGSKLIKVN